MALAQTVSPGVGCPGWHSDSFCSSPRKDSTTCFATLSPKTIKCFHMLRKNHLHFSLCPFPLVLVLGTTEKNLSQNHVYLRHLFILPSNICTPEISINQSTHISPYFVLGLFCLTPFLMLQYLDHLSKTSLTLQNIHDLHVPGSPELYTVFHTWPHQCWEEGKILPPLTYWQHSS